MQERNRPGSPVNRFCPGHRLNRSGTSLASGACMETQPMPHAHVHRRRSAIRRALMPALALSVLPLGAAFAQSVPYVRVTRDGTEIRSLRQTDDVRMKAPKGTLMEVVYIEGDRYVHR